MTVTETIKVIIEYDPATRETSVIPLLNVPPGFLLLLRKELPDILSRLR